MLKVWGAAVLLYSILPFHLVARELTLQGYLVLILFLSAFCFGTLLAKLMPLGRGALMPQSIDFSRAEFVLSIAGVITITAFLLDLREKSVFDLALAYQLRSDQAGALLEGADSSSGLPFQLGFLTYPAAYVYGVRAVIFERRLPWWRLAVFCFFPILLATLAMGGRFPLLYGLLILFLSVGARRTYRDRHDNHSANARKSRFGFFSTVGVIAIVFGAVYYFIAVFFTRAELAGGGAGMFEWAEDVWGVSFHGPVADAMFHAIGQEWTYIIFIFNWYVVQGQVMANFLFTDYQGPMQFGVYGVDLITALARRLDSEMVARYFDELLQLGTYGFLPSAWGSLYVDLRFFGLIVSAVWGALAALVYRRIQRGRDSRWLLFAPFVTMGIVFSLINTPLGFANGLMTHFWLVVAFMISHQRTPARNKVIAALSSIYGNGIQAGKL